VSSIIIIIKYTWREVVQREEELFGGKVSDRFAILSESILAPANLQSRLTVVLM
jgi:hypothetical protein